MNILQILEYVQGLREMHKAAKVLAKDWPGIVAKVRPILEARMKRDNCSTLAAAIAYAKESEACETKVIYILGTAYEMLTAQQPATDAGEGKHV